ncbi:MAG: SDR family NAD(P)-dependent oxidoreductase [Dehalococcoidales bacterium]|jgi:NAD(P)-dependent dehydrogenase (short-subunit alcohol dehydrogenase family)
MYNLRDKVAIITGASKGIGKATGEKFAQMGATTILVSHSGLDETEKKRLPRNHSEMSYGCDVSSEKQVSEMVADIIGRFSKIDILVNNAAITQNKKLEDISLSEWNFVIATNITAQFLMCKYCVPFMKEQRYGKIINVSSIAAKLYSAMSGIHYVTSKAAVIGFTRQLAYELAPFNINVNAVCPGQTYTPMLMGNLTRKSEEMLKKSIPLGYIASPEQQANVILFLASDEANYMTGAIVDVNGGQL